MSSLADDDSMSTTSKVAPPEPDATLVRRVARRMRRWKGLRTMFLDWSLLRGAMAVVRASVRERDTKQSSAIAHPAARYADHP